MSNHNSVKEMRSQRNRNVIEISKKDDWCIGHILFLWLVDRYFRNYLFSAEEKK